jgi:hypothetical protein
LARKQIAILKLSLVVACIISFQASAQILCRTSFEAIQARTSAELLNTLPPVLWADRSKTEALLALNSLNSLIAGPEVVGKTDLQKGDYNWAVMKSNLIRSTVVQVKAKKASDFDYLKVVDLASQHEIGSIEFTPRTNAPGAVFLSHIQGDQYAPKRLITKALLEALLERYPETTELRMEMDAAMVATVQAALMKELTPHQAIALTPMYQTLQAVGFATIVPATTSVARWEEYLTVRRSR